MKEAYEQVLNFHKKYDCCIGKTPSVPKQGTITLRKNLIEEEYNELLSALTQCDLLKIADGIGDCIYVLIGTAISYGIDLPAVWTAIHNHNMQKTGGKRSDGKILKTKEDGIPDIKFDL